MQLAVRDAAKLLNVSEKTIYRWIKQETIPAYRVSDQYRFNRAELLEWATTRRLEISPEIFHEESGPTAHLPGIAQALQTGGIAYQVAGGDKEAVLQTVVENMRLPAEVRRDFLLQVLLAREALGSTAVGNGIAIPHVRNPIILHLPQPFVTLSFLEQAVDFGAMDGQAVHTLFTIVSPTVRSHLHLLSRLTFILRDAGFKAALTERTSPERLYAAAAHAEAHTHPTTG